MLTPTFVESSERVKAKKEKEEEEELARVLAWEQKQIRELQERRERMRRERRAEIERRREQEKALRELKAQQEKQRRRRVEVDDLGGGAAPRQAEEHLATDHMRIKEGLERKRVESQPGDSLSKRRRQELMARFGSQARLEDSNEREDRNLEYESDEAEDRQENELNSSGPSEERDSWKANDSQKSEPEPENAVDEEMNDAVEPKKTLVRKTIQRRLSGIKTFSESKSGETFVKDTEDKAAALEQGHVMKSTTAGIGTSFAPTVYNSPSGTDPVVVQPVLT
ncbi:hypothetical protein OSTOST_04464 [Ostertagia ostertagi]